MRNKLGTKGFTIVEMLIALALISLVGTGLFSVYWMSNKAFTRDSSNSDLQYIARTVMADITSHVIQASSVTISGENDVLELQLPAERILYTLNRSTNWFYRTMSGSPQPVSEKIADVRYAAVGTNSIKITVTASDGTNNFSLTSQVVPRKELVVSGGISYDQIPVISLIGSNQQTVAVGKTYTDPGVTATDAEDGDISANITPDPDTVLVDTSIPALITITYRVNDSAGQTVAVNRSVSVEGSFTDSGSSGGGSSPMITGAIGNAVYIWDKVREVWTTMDPGLLDWGGLVEVQINDIVANGDKLVLVGENAGDDGFGRIANSSDGGDTWKNDIDIDLATTKHLSSVAYGNGVYVTVGASRDVLGLFAGGRILSSTDGVHWTSRTSAFNPLDNALNSVSFGNGMFVTVGDAGDIYTSGDGISWTQKKSGAKDDLNGIIWSSKLNNWVAVGENGTVLCSATADSGTWKKQNSTTTSELADVVFGANKYIAVGAGGTIIKSGDGINWEKNNLPTDTITDKVRNAAFRNISCIGAVFIITVDPTVKVKDPKDNIEKNVLLQSNDGGNTWLQQLVEPE